jgi:diguanylate cyclase (GGDEF)-like protein
MEQAARILVEALLERGALAVLERTRSGGNEILLLRDPARRIRARIRLPLYPRGPEARSIPLPLEWSARTGIRYHEVQGLLALQSTLVTSDRVMTPRDLVARLERALQEMLPVASAAFVPLEMPPGEDWPSPPVANGVPVPSEQLETLSRRRDQLLHFPDLGKDGSVLVLGLGDDESGWRGYLVLRHPDREHFTRERLAPAQLVAHHFQGLISSSIRLQGLIFFDVLTGIYNRSYFETQIEREIAMAHRREQSLALLLIDVDDFRSFNSRYGYDGGDQVLATVADVLKMTLRTTDTLARYGGEEFTAILSAPLPLEEARLIAERVRAAVADEPLPIHGLDGRAATEHVTVSIGGVLYPSGGRTYRELWNAANRLLLEAKARGKNQVRFVGDPG